MGTNRALDVALVLLAALLILFVVSPFVALRESEGPPARTPDAPADTRDEQHALESERSLDSTVALEPTAELERQARAVTAYPPRNGPKGSVVVRAVWKSSGGPAANVRVGLDRGSGAWPLPVAQSRTDATGMVRFENVDTGSVRVLCDLAADARTNVELVAVAEVEFRLEAGTTVTGRVWDAGGRSLSGATIWIDDDGGWQPLAECDADGRYRVEHVRPGASLIATMRGMAPSDVVRVEWLFPAKELEHDFTVSGPATSVLGQILDSSGAPVSGAVVTLGFRELGDWPSISDDEGRFAHHSAQPGAAWLGVWSAHFAPARMELDVSLDTRNEHIVRLETGAELSGVIELEGVPVEGARVMVGSGEPDWDVWGIATTDAQGHYRLSGLPPGLHRATAGLPPDAPAWKPRPPNTKDLRARGVVELIAGRTVMWNAELKRDE